MESGQESLARWLDEVGAKLVRRARGSLYISAGPALLCTCGLLASADIAEWGFAALALLSSTIVWSCFGGTGLLCLWAEGRLVPDYPTLVPLFARPGREESGDRWMHQCRLGLRAAVVEYARWHLGVRAALWWRRDQATRRGLSRRMANRVCLWAHVTQVRFVLAFFLGGVLLIGHAVLLMEFAELPEASVVWGLALSAAASQAVLVVAGVYLLGWRRLIAPGLRRRVDKSVGQT